MSYTAEQFRLQAAMCIENAAAQPVEALKAGWLESAEQLLAMAQENYRTAFRVTADQPVAHAVEELKAEMADSPHELLEGVASSQA